MNELYGRKLLLQEISTENRIRVKQQVEVRQIRGFEEKDGQTSCTRCGEGRAIFKEPIPCPFCKEPCYYCSQCIQMGRIKKCDTLYYLPTPEKQVALSKENLLTWKGQLSQQQQEASDKVVVSVKKHETRLIWAVAGAGKTEMMFEGIAEALAAGKRVCFASPRVDVCLEITPRLQSAFKHTDIITLYGGKEEAYRYTDLVVATTHQLLRFYKAFDVLIIDEIDAFPFKDNALLHQAAESARKKVSTLLYLTATPDGKLQNCVKKQLMKACILPARYHGHPLPIPNFQWVGNWRKQLKKRRLSAILMKTIREIVNNNRRCLLFLPHIQSMHQVEHLLKVAFVDKVILSVFAQDEERKMKVMQMRAEQVDILLTTTILERGVTFRDIDVIVLGAEDRTFTKASLIQISGRVGRHKDFPTGKIIFLHYGISREMRESRKEMKLMNDLAAERGLLHGM